MLDVATGWPAEWVDVLGLGDTFVAVTPEQMADLRDRLDALLVEFCTVGEGDPLARRVSIYSFARPVELGPPPGEEEG